MALAKDLKARRVNRKYRRSDALEASVSAHVQRPLWASTSVKNPDYPDTMYVDELIGPNTENTVPPDTLESFLDHGSPARSIDSELESAWAHIEEKRNRLR